VRKEEGGRAIQPRAYQPRGAERGTDALACVIAAVARVQIAREHAPAAVHVRHDDVWHRAPPLRLDFSVPPAAINAPPRMTSRAFSMMTWINLLALAAVCHGKYAS